MSIASYTYAEVKSALKAAGHVVSEGEAWVSKDLKAFETYISEIVHTTGTSSEVSALDPQGLQAAHHGFLYNCAPSWLIKAIKGEDVVETDPSTTYAPAATDAEPVVDTSAADEAAAAQAQAQAQAQAEAEAQAQAAAQAEAEAQAAAAQAQAQAEAEAAAKKAAEGQSGEGSADGQGAQ